MDSKEITYTFEFSSHEIHFEHESFNITNSLSANQVNLYKI